MTALVKYKNPVEYSFRQWMDNYPESAHWADRGRFVEFTKNVCVYNAKKWKDVVFLKQRILEIKPNFEEDCLSDLISAFEFMVDFYKTPARRLCIEDHIAIKKGYYIERGFKNGKYYENELPIKGRTN